jgi:hypothetical protein
MPSLPIARPPPFYPTLSVASSLTPSPPALRHFRLQGHRPHQHLTASSISPSMASLQPAAPSSLPPMAHRRQYLQRPQSTPCTHQHRSVASSHADSVHRLPRLALYWNRMVFVFCASPACWPLFLSCALTALPSAVPFSPLSTARPVVWRLAKGGCSPHMALALLFSFPSSGPCRLLALSGCLLLLSTAARGGGENGGGAAGRACGRACT